MKLSQTTFFTLLLSFASFVSVEAQESFPEPKKMEPGMSEYWTPQPKVVTPGQAATNRPTPAPSDAELLFDGKDLSKWMSQKTGGPAQWTVNNGAFTVKKGTGNIQTKKNFKDFQLHIEWLIPEDITGKSQARGNSGIFLQGMYEVQILDNYNNPTYVNGQAGSIYKQTPPLVNAMNKPGVWNTYDIIYTAPTFDKNGNYRTFPYVTVIHNGVVVQNNTRINGSTQYIGFPQVKPHDDGPLILQDHGDPSEPISFRNIWIREL